MNDECDFEFHKQSVSFQMTPFVDSNRITCSIDCDGELFAMLTDGTFGRVNISDIDKCSFVPICNSKNESTDWRRNYLCYE